MTDRIPYTLEGRMRTCQFEPSAREFDFGTVEPVRYEGADSGGRRLAAGAVLGWIVLLCLLLVLAWW